MDPLPSLTGGACMGLEANFQTSLGFVRALTSCESRPIRGALIPMYEYCTVATKESRLRCCFICPIFHTKKGATFVAPFLFVFCLELEPCEESDRRDPCQSSPIYNKGLVLPGEPVTFKASS